MVIEETLKLDDPLWIRLHARRLWEIRLGCSTILHPSQMRRRGVCLNGEREPSTIEQSSYEVLTLGFGRKWMVTWGKWVIGSLGSLEFDCDWLGREVRMASWG